MATMVVLSGPHRGERHELPPGGLSVGREQEVDVEVGLGTRGVSGLHARIWCEEGAWMLKDLGSTNGTFVQGERVNSVRLEHGGIVLLADVELQFELDPPPAPETVQPPQPAQTPRRPPTRPPVAQSTSVSGPVPDGIRLAAEMMLDRSERIDPVYEGLELLLSRLERAVEDGGSELTQTAAAMVGPRGELREQLVDLKEILDDLSTAARHLHDTTR